MQSPRTHLRLTDELGLAKTPARGHRLVRRSPRPEWLILGLGPDPAGLAAALEAARGEPPCPLAGVDPDLRERTTQAARRSQLTVRYLECPAFLEALGADWRAGVPASWQAVESFDPRADCNILLHEGSPRLFPAFWSPVLAALALPVPGELGQLPPRTAVMPAVKERLLTRELAQALVAEGYQVLSPRWDDLAQVLRQGRPDLFLTVNFAGLDEYGQAAALLGRAGVPVAVWCVDNPFNALSGLKGVFWRDLHLFVTDDWYLKPLRAHGARSVHHLPLAACQDFFRALPDRPELSDALLFVGRSAFPGRRDFFAGLTPPPQLMSEALSMLREGRRPDFGWWASRLGLERFWPGRQARLPALGAEESGRAWRAMILEEAARVGRLVVRGDAAWRELVQPPFELAPPVDYYGPLAGMYASARVTLNATSPQLPRGLTQRHFDVWAAGGCLVSDKTPGLDIFPSELVRETSFESPSQVAAAIERAASGRDGLSGDWRTLIAREHTYAHRIRTILETII